MIEEFEKQCNRCLEIKHPSLFYKRSGRAATYGDGLMRHCKACHNQRVRAWKEGYPDRAREIQRRANAKYSKKRYRNDPVWAEAERVRQKKYYQTHKRDNSGRFMKGNEYLSGHPLVGKRTMLFGMRVTREEREEMEQAAAGGNLSLSEFIRKVIWDEARSRGFIL